MATSGVDPYRVLGVSRDAGEAEVRRAFRALAKRHHPDAHHGSVARFLEIHAAYEALVAGRPATAGPRGGVRAEGDGAASAGPASTAWARRPRGTAAGAGERAGRRGSAGGEGRGPGPAGDPARGRRGPGRRRATLGSTSYDEAEEAFEPDWGGASWYGPTSGTYWTLNPKEYADPRKHGPAYQARARRGSGDGRTAEQEAEGAGGPSAPRPEAPGSTPRHAGRAGGEAARPRRQADVEGAAPGAAAARAAGTAPGAQGRATAAHEAPFAREQAAAAAPGVAWRVVLAVLGWIVPGLTIAAAAGLPGGIVATLPLQAGGAVLLALAPRAAWAALGGAAALVAALVPIVALVAALGGAFVPGGPPPPVVALAALAWAGGAVLVARDRVAPYPWRGRGRARARPRGTIPG